MKSLSVRLAISKTAIALLFLLLLNVFMGCHLNNAAKQVADIAPGTTLQRLLNGNKQFFLLKPTYPHETPRQLLDAAKKQHPFSVIISCPDSRVPPELIFDAGIGDLFVIGTAAILLMD